MRKRLLTLALAFTFIFSCMPVIHAEVLGPVTSIANAIPDCHEFTPPANLFRLEGDNTDFILLDTTFDDQSKFFVMTKDDYGTMAFDPDGTQRFDVEDNNNIAHWLNNAFLTEGGANGKSLPPQVIEYMNPEAKFDTEAAHANGNAPQGYTVTAKVALLSQTEYSKYYRKFGIRDNMQGSAWWLRTAFSKTGTDTMLVPKISDPEVNGRTIQWPAANKLLVRPVFYLTKDFFKHVKLQVPILGSEVKKAILANYTEDELKAVGYTDDEIAMIKDTSIDVSEKFTLTMPNKEDIGKLMEPSAASFDITGTVAGKTEKEYSLYFECPELGIPKTVSKMKMTPGVEFHRTYKLKDIQNGVGVLKVTIKDGDRISCTMQEDLYIMPKYKPQFMDEFSEHGVGTHYPQAGQSNSNDTAMLVRAGIKQIRDSIGWASLEMEDGSWDSKKTDVYVPAVTIDAGIDWTAILYGTHPNYTTVAPSASSEITGFANYAKKLKEIYPQINEFEIWNEPNLSSWKPKPQGLEYQKLCKVVGKELLSVDPDTHVIAGSINSFDNSYTKTMMKDGLYPYMTHFSYHPYITPAEVDEEYEMKWGRLLDTTLSYGGWKDIYVTEVGWPTHDSPTGNTEYKQAVEVPKMYIVADAMNLKNNAYYTFRDPGTDIRENEHMFGLIRRNMEPKLSYMTTSQLNSALAGGVYVGQMFLDGDITAHVYMKNHEPVIAIWTTKGDTVTNFDFGEEVSVVDMCGNAVQPVSGNTYAITREIQYVTGAGKAWFNKAVAQFDGTKMDELLKDHANGMPAEIVTNLAQSRDYLKSLASAATLPSEGEISEKMAFHYQQGASLLNAHKDGKSGMTDTDVSIALFLMHRVGVGYGNLLAAVSTSSEGITSADRVGTVRDAIAARSKTYYDGSLQFTEAITYYAAQHSKDAKEIKAIGMSNPSKNGIVKAYDRLANELLNWAENWCAFEPVISTAFLVEVPVADTSIFTGESRDIQVGIRSFSDTAQTGTVQIFDPDGVKFAETSSVTVEPNSVTEVTLQAMFEYDFQNIPQEFTLKFINNKKDVLGSSLVTFNVQDKVKVTYAEQNETVDKVNELKITLKNIYTDAVSGTISLTPPEGWTLGNSTASFSLPVDGEQTLTFKVNGTSPRPFNFYTVKTVLTDSNGLKILEGNYPLSFTPIVKNTGTIAVEGYQGDISDWADAYPVFINQPKDSAALKEWHNADISGMVFLKWDEENLYMLYNIYDEKYIQKNTGNGMWSGDSIQFSLDCKNTKGTSYDLDDYEIGFAYTTNGIEKYCWTAPDASMGGEWTDDIVNILRDDGLKLTRSLVVLPKDRVPPLELKQGNKIGFNVALNDSDFDKRETYVQITNGTANGKNPSYYHSFEMIGPQTPEGLDLVDKYNLPIDLTMDYENNFASFGDVFLANTDDEEEETALFADIVGHWAKADIENMAKRGIVNGVGDKLFEPERNITREEFVALLAKSGMDASDYKGALSDVTAETWSAGYIQAAMDSGVIPPEMYADGAFYPERPITREEMAVMVVNMYAYRKSINLASGESVFSDEASFSPWTVDAINAAYKAGIVNGVAEGIFDPAANATRAEATVIVKRLLAKL